MPLLDDRLDSVAEDLEPLGWQVMFFGAGVLHRYLDVPAVVAEPPRPTEDVDALVQLTDDGSKTARRVEVALERNGWTHDKPKPSGSTSSRVTN